MTRRILNKGICTCVQMKFHKMNRLSENLDDRLHGFYVRFDSREGKTAKVYCSILQMKLESKTR